MNKPLTIVLALALAPAVHATPTPTSTPTSTSTSYASLTNLQFTSKDLRPHDGTEAGFGFVMPAQTVVVVSNTADGPPGHEKSVEGGFSELSISQDDGHAQVGPGFLIAKAASHTPGKRVDVTAYTGGGGIEHGQGWQQIMLDPHASLTMSGFAQLSTHCAEGVGRGCDNTLAYVHFGFLGVVYRETWQWLSARRPGETRTEQRFMEATIENHSDEPMVLGFQAYVQAFADPLSPVPEPGTYALLLVGLAMLGAHTRRRQS